jgi:choline monooxygenase
MNHILPPLWAVLETLDRGESLPAWWYTDPAVLDREMERIFRRSWQYVGPAAKLTHVGDYLTAQAGGIPVVVVRNPGGLAGFVNVCRHRRHEVMSGSGRAQVLRCPYHAWTYDLEGGLKGAPGTGGEPGFDPGDFPLLPVRVGLLGPFVFVAANPEIAPVETFYGSLLGTIAGCGLDLGSLVLHSREEWRSGANWKTLLENYLECYHCPVAHPGFSAVVDVDRDRYGLSFQDACLSQTAQAQPPRPDAGVYDGSGPITEAQYHLAWPNFTLNLNPGLPNLSVDVWHPDGVRATRGFTEQYFAPGVPGAWAEALIQFNRQVGEEDDRLTDSVQRGLAAGLPETGRILPRRERLILQFQRRVAEAVCGQAPSVRTGARNG